MSLQARSVQASPNLSIELIHRIIDEVSELDRKSLIQCCLASKTLYLVSRARVWRDLVFRSGDFKGDGHIERITRLRDVLQSSHQDPQIPPLISILRTISISLPWKPEYTIAYNRSSWPKEYPLFGLYPLADLLGALDGAARSSNTGCGVHSVRIQCEVGSFRANGLWSNIWKPIRDAIAQLVTAPTVHTVHVQRMSGVPVGLLTRSPALRNLVLRYSQFHTGTLPSLDSVESARPIAGHAAKVEHLKVHNCVMGMTDSEARGIDPKKYEDVPLGTFLQLIADPTAIRSLDLVVTPGHTATVVHFLCGATRCDTLTLRYDIRGASNLFPPSWILPTSLRSLTLISTFWDFEAYDMEMEWDPNRRTEVFISGDEGTSITDAISVPTAFTTPEQTSIVLPHVTIHRPLHINLPTLHPPTSNFMPMGYEYMDVLPTGHVRVSFWEVFARAVHQIPAVEVEVQLPILVVLVNDEFDMKSTDGKELMKREADEICRTVEGVFEDVRMELEASRASQGLPKVQLHVSARFTA